MSNWLAKVIAQKKLEVEQLLNSTELDWIADQKISDRKIKSFSAALTQNHLAVIAEIKRQSPSKGQLAAILDPIKLAHEYVRGGAQAISVLTDQPHFGGSLQDLLDVSSVLKDFAIPILRKDFIIHPIQVDESLAFGADAILLIVAAVQNHLQELLDYAHLRRLEVLVEVHNLSELEIALEADARIIGVNNRDLKSLQVDLNQSLQIITHIPDKIIAVAESGITSPLIAQQLYKAGFNAVLVGEMLVKAENPAEIIGQMMK